MIRVAIADDEEMVCLYLRRILEKSGQVAVTGHALDGDEAVILAARTNPDAVLLDVRMHGRSGLEVLPRLRALHPAPAVIVLTNFPADLVVRQAVDGGAVGVLVKTTPPEDLVELLRLAVKGYQVFGAGMLRPVLTSSSTLDAQTAAVLTRLTQRERHVLALLASGCSNSAIADRLGITEPTVKSHVSALMSKLRCRSRLQVGLLGARFGRAGSS